MDLKGKVAIITGSAMGLGRAFAARLLEDGAKVCLSDLQEEVGLRTLSDLKERFGEEAVHFIKCDVTKKTELESLYDGCEEHFGGKVDIFCNNAGVNHSVGWKKCMDINIMAVMEGTYLAMDRMNVQKGGKGGLVINTASVAGIITSDYNDPDGLTTSDWNSYYVSKSGVVALTRSLANKAVLLETGVQLRSFCPFFAETNLLNKWVEGEEMRQKVDNVCGVMSPEQAAEAFHSLVTTCENGDALVVAKDIPSFVYPDINLKLVTALSAGSLIGSKVFGVKVVKPKHQVLVLLLLILLLFICFHLILNWLF